MFIVQDGQTLTPAGQPHEIPPEKIRKGVKWCSSDQGILNFTIPWLGRERNIEMQTEPASQSFQ